MVTATRLLDGWLGRIGSVRGEAGALEAPKQLLLQKLTAKSFAALGGVLDEGFESLTSGSGVGFPLLRLGTLHALFGLQLVP